MRGGTLVLFFGEDSNDSRALAHIVNAIAGTTRKLDTRQIRQPPVLRHDAALRKKQAMSATIAAYAEELSPGRVRVIVVAHRDCDAVEPAHVQSAQTLEQELAAAGVKYPVAATPAWEIETWWMAFPEALRATKACWREVDYGTRNLGVIADAKEKLRRDLRPVDAAAQRRCSDFTESDGIAVAEQVHKRGLMTDGRPLPASLDDFAGRFAAALP